MQTTRLQSRKHLLSRSLLKILPAGRLASNGAMLTRNGSCPHASLGSTAVKLRSRRQTMSRRSSATEDDGNEADCEDEDEEEWWKSGRSSDLYLGSHTGSSCLLTGLTSSISLDVFDRPSGSSTCLAASEAGHASHSPGCSSAQVQLHLAGRAQRSKKLLSTSAAVEAWAPVEANTGATHTDHPPVTSSFPDPCKLSSAALLQATISTCSSHSTSSSSCVGSHSLTKEESSSSKRVSFVSESSRSSPRSQQPRTSWAEVPRVQPQTMLRQCLSRSNPQHPGVMLSQLNLQERRSLPTAVPRLIAPAPLWQRQQQRLLSEQKLLQQRENRQFARRSSPQQYHSREAEKDERPSLSSPEDHQQTPHSPLEQGWWQRADGQHRQPQQTQKQHHSSKHKDLAASYQSSPQQQDWRDFAYPKPSPNLHPRHQRAQEESGHSSPCNACFESPERHPTRPASTHFMHARGPSVGNSSPFSLQLSALKVGAYDSGGMSCSPRDSGGSATSVGAARMHPTCKLTSSPMASCSSSPSRFTLSSLFPSALSAVFKRQQQQCHTVHRLSSDRHNYAGYFPSAERQSASSEGSVAPSGLDRWPGAVAPSVHSNLTTASEQPSRSAQSMEGDLLALADLTLRYSQEANYPCRLSAQPPSSPDNMVSNSQIQDVMVSRFSNDPMSPPPVPRRKSRNSTDLRYNFSYASSRLRYSFDATSMAVSSLLYHPEPSAPVVAAMGEAVALQEGRPIRLGDYGNPRFVALQSPTGCMTGEDVIPPQATQTPFYGQMQARGTLLDRVSEGLSDHPPSIPASHFPPPRVPTTGQMQFAVPVPTAPRPTLSWWQKLTSKRPKSATRLASVLSVEEPSVRRRQAVTPNEAHDASVRRGQALLAARILPQTGLDLLAPVPELRWPAGPSCDSRGSWGGLGAFDPSEGWSNPGGESNAGVGEGILAQDSRKPGGGFFQEALEVSGTMPWCISSSQLSMPQQQWGKFPKSGSDLNLWARS